jgi:hypothetical protein
VQDIDTSRIRRARVEALGETGVVLPIFNFFLERRLKRCFEMDKE